MLLWIILFTTIGSLFSLIGGFILLRKKTATENISVRLVSFAAGVLLATSFFDLLPEALGKSGGNEQFFLPIFAAMVAFFLLERTLFWYHHHHAPHGVQPSLYLLILGDTVHNFIDGVAIAASFLISLPLGITTSLAVAAHEIPQEMADFSIMLSKGVTKKKAIIYNILSALSSYIGAIITFFFFDQVGAQLWILIAATAGMFIYIATADLIPELHESDPKTNFREQILLFIFGILISYVFITVVGMVVEVDL